MKKIKLTIDGKEVFLSQESIKAIQNLAQKKEYNYKNWEEYYWLDSCGYIDISISINNDGTFSQGGLFRTKQEAEQERDKRQAKHNIKKYIIENGLEFEPNWGEGGEKKYVIYYDYTYKKFIINCHFESKYFQPFFFKSREDAQQVIDNCEKDLLVLGGIK